MTTPPSTSIATPLPTPFLKTSVRIAPPMLHHGSHGVASKLFAPKGRTPLAFMAICVLGRPWRLYCVWGLSRGVIFGLEWWPAESLPEGKKAAHPCVQG